MSTKHLLCCVVLIGVQLNTVSAQSVRWEVADGGNGHWYEVIQGLIDAIFGGIQRVINWPDAYFIAQVHGGSLVTMTSSDEIESSTL